MSAVEDDFELWKAGDEFLAATERVRQATGTTMDIDRAVDEFVAARTNVRAWARYTAGLGGRPQLAEEEES